MIVFWSPVCGPLKRQWAFWRASRPYGFSIDYHSLQFRTSTIVSVTHRKKNSESYFKMFLFSISFYDLSSITHTIHPFRFNILKNLRFTNNSRWKKRRVKKSKMFLQHLAKIHLLEWISKNDPSFLDTSIFHQESVLALSWMFSTILVFFLIKILVEL